MSFLSLNSLFANLHSKQNQGLPNYCKMSKVISKQINFFWELIFFRNSFGKEMESGEDKRNKIDSKFVNSEAAGFKIKKNPLRILSPVISAILKETLHFIQNFISSRSSVKERERNFFSVSDLTFPTFGLWKMKFGTWNKKGEESI